MKLLSIYKRVLKESKDDYTKSAGAIIYCKSTNRVLLQLSIDYTISNGV